MENTNKKKITMTMTKNTIISLTSRSACSQKYNNNVRPRNKIHTFSYYRLPQAVIKLFFCHSQATLLNIVYKIILIYCV